MTIIESNNLKADAKELGRLVKNVNTLLKTSTRKGELVELSKQINDIKEYTLELAQDIKDLITGKRPPIVAFVGKFSAGKSSVINCLLGQNICPVRADPTTSSITEFKFSNQNRIECKSDENKFIKEISHEEYEKLVCHSDKRKNQIYQFKYEASIPLLKRATIIDTPGFNNPENPKDAKITEKVMQYTDALFYVIDVNTSSIGADGEKFFAQIKKNTKDVAFYLIINKADLKKNPEARRKILSELEEKYGNLFKRIILFSAECKDTMAYVASNEEILECFEEMFEDKTILLGGSLRGKKERLLSKRKHSLSNLKRYLQKVLNQTQVVPSSHKKNKVTTEMRRLKSELTGELSKLALRIAKNCLKVKEIENSGWFGWFWKDAEIVTDFRGALGKFQKSYIWSKMTRTFKSLLNQLNLKNDLLENKWASDLSRIRRSSYNSFKSALEEEIEDDLSDEYKSKDKAQSALDDYLEELEDSIPNEIGKEGAKPVKEMLSRWEDKLLKIIEQNEKKFVSHINALKDTIKHIEKLIKQEVI